MEVSHEPKRFQLYLEQHRYLSSIATLSPEQVRRLNRELESKLVAGSKVSRPNVDPVLGSMSDHGELMDQIIEDAIRHREQEPWWLKTGE